MAKGDRQRQASEAKVMQQLRGDGHTYVAIAERYGRSKQSIHRSLKRHMAREVKAGE